MTTGAWIVIYLAVSTCVALAAWRESSRLDRVRKIAHLRRIVRERRLARALRHARAWHNLSEVCEKLAQVIGGEVAQSFASAQRSLEGFAEAWGKRR